jgi:hypothetical protein
MTYFWPKFPAVHVRSDTTTKVSGYTARGCATDEQNGAAS